MEIAFEARLPGGESPAFVVFFPAGCLVSRDGGYTTRGALGSTASCGARFFEELANAVVTEQPAASFRASVEIVPSDPNRSNWRFAIDIVRVESPAGKEPFLLPRVGGATYVRVAIGDDGGAVRARSFASGGSLAITAPQSSSSRPDSSILPSFLLISVDLWNEVIEENEFNNGVSCTWSDALGWECH